MTMQYKFRTALRAAAIITLEAFLPTAVQAWDFLPTAPPKKEAENPWSRLPWKTAGEIAGSGELPWSAQDSAAPGTLSEESHGAAERDSSTKDASGQELRLSKAPENPPDRDSKLKDANAGASAAGTQAAPDQGRLTIVEAVDYTRSGSR